MPNFDAGHYFLTTIAPIKRTTGDEGAEGSPLFRLRKLLHGLPTAKQSPATEKSAFQSPFAKSLRTHLCRFVIIEDTIYNGRIPEDPLLSGAHIRPDPADPQHVDRLPCAYLMFTADFDATTKVGERLPDMLSPAEQDRVRDDYLRELWEVAEPDLRAIYSNCQAFTDETIKTGDDFARYIARCQIETCMPFNDYYLDMPKVSLLPVKLIGAAIAIPLLAFLICALGWLTGFETGLWAIITLVITCFSLFMSYRYAMANGNKPWPASEHGDLPSVLKGLYIQQYFSRFIEDNQGKDPDEVYEAFGAFLAEHKPEEKLEKTQAPGVIGSL